MLKLLPFLLLFCAGALSQDDLSEEERYRQKIIREHSPQNDPRPDELDKTFEETAESLSNYGGMELDGEALEEAEESFSDDEPRAQVKESYLSNFMSAAGKKFIEEFLSDNPFAKVPRKEMKALIVARVAGMPFGDTLERYPGLLEFLVDFVRDEKAIPSMLGIVNQPKKVKNFGMIAIGIFVMVFILNLFNSKGNIFRRILTKLCIGLFAFVCNITIFYIVFKDEISPTLGIVWKHLPI